jgi:hypothetical protein
MEELNTPIFAQAKVEYTKQLIEILYPHMFDGIKSIYDESKVIYSSKTGTPILLLFRELLEKVPIWNSEIIDSECSRIVNNSKCDWIDDLITAVFISHTKILTSIGPNQSFQKINVTIPKTSTFVHKSYINAARELWKNPYLFNEGVPGHEYQKNNKEIENIIKNCIENTIRNLLPIKEILKEHLEGETDNNLLNQKEVLKELLREELSGLSMSSKISTQVDDEEDKTDDKAGDKTDDKDEDKTDDNTNPIIIREIDDEEESPSKEVSIGELEKTDLLPLIQEKISEMVENNPVPESIPDATDGTSSSVELFPSSDDPTDDQVTKQCSDIVVNDITIPVVVPTDNPVTDTDKPVVEIKYDNIDVTSGSKVAEDSDHLKRLMTNMEVKEEVNVIKSNEIAVSEPVKPEPVKAPSFTLNSLYPNMNQPTPPPESKSTEQAVVANNQIPEPSSNPVTEPLQIIKEDKPIVTDEPKSPRKEMVVVKNEDDIDETSSLAHFFQDMKQIVEKKGIQVETNTDNSFSLFEDAITVEK